MENMNVTTFERYHWLTRERKKDDALRNSFTKWTLNNNGVSGKWKENLQFFLWTITLFLLNECTFELHYMHYTTQKHNVRAAKHFYENEWKGFFLIKVFPEIKVQEYFLKELFVFFRHGSETTGVIRIHVHVYILLF